MRTRNESSARGRPIGSGVTRQRVCAEAARIMAEEGVNDFHQAKRRATQRLNLPEGKNLPSNQEIEEALREHLALFHGARLVSDLTRLRTAALEAMKFLARFDPRLVGSVLNGVVTPSSEVQLHICADTPEEISLLFVENQIPVDQGERRLRFGGERELRVPAYRFVADGVPIEVCVLSPTAARETPLSPVDGRPMQRANLRDLESLLKNPDSHVPLPPPGL